jgi:glycosyltransferase involved in cell wall biosynthesis
MRVVRQANKGHGGAINTGLAAVTGLYTKVLDADDWFDRQALSSLLAVLAGLAEATSSVDVVVTNFVYNNVARSRPCPVRYTRALPAGGPITWHDVRRFRPREYLMMHSLAYRTELLRGCGLTLPEHTYYVDCIFAFTPLFHVRTLYYLDVDLYQYLIGRPGQSVNESVMLERIDQQVEVARKMLSQMRAPLALEPGQRAYLLHYLDLVCTVTSSLLLRSGEAGCLARRREFWREVRGLSPALHRRLRWSLLGTMMNLPGSFGRRTSLAGYRLARRVVGFN